MFQRRFARSKLTFINRPHFLTGKAEPELPPLQTTPSTTKPSKSDKDFLHAIQVCATSSDLLNLVSKGYKFQDDQESLNSGPSRLLADIYQSLADSIKSNSHDIDRQIDLRFSASDVTANGATSDIVRTSYQEIIKKIEPILLALKSSGYQVTTGWVEGHPTLNRAS